MHYNISCCSQSEQSRPEGSAGAPSAEEGGADEGIWVPEEYLGHEAAARDLANEAASDGAGVSEWSVRLTRSCQRLCACSTLMLLA